MKLKRMKFQSSLVHDGTPSVVKKRLFDVTRLPFYPSGIWRGRLFCDFPCCNFPRLTFSAFYALSFSITWCLFQQKTVVFFFPVFFPNGHFFGLKRSPAWWWVLQGLALCLGPRTWVCWRLDGMVDPVGNQKSGIHSPVEVGSEYPIIY